MPPNTRYAKSGDVHIAYQVFGSGPLNLVIVPPFVSNIEVFWELPDLARWLERLAGFARVAMFDKRGTGMSDRVAELPGLDQRMDDLRAVMDAAGMEQAALLGISEGAPLAVMFTATYPERCRALVLSGGFARFSYWFPTEEELSQFLGYVEQAWGSGASAPFFVPTVAQDPGAQRWFARFERLGASPAAVTALMRMNSQIDVSDILPTIQVPTLIVHRAEDVTINVEGGRNLAQNIPGARYLEFSGKDHPPFIGDHVDDILDAIQEFLTGSRAPVVIDRVLATVLFSDIVGSTELAARVGDRRWRDLLEGFYSVARQQLARFRGREIDTAGDGFFAAFDGPARAISCARAMSEAVRGLGMETRTGVHTGECEMIGEKIGGIAVHIGARVAGKAGPNEILVSSTVKDLVAGSGIQFEDRGTHHLKGIPGGWRVFAAV